jgi:hypothetical protein
MYQWFFETNEGFKGDVTENDILNLLMILIMKIEVC